MINMFIMCIITNSVRMSVADRQKKSERNREREGERDGKASVK